MHKLEVLFFRALTMFHNNLPGHMQVALVGTYEQCSLVNKYYLICSVWVLGILFVTVAINVRSIWPMQLCNFGGKALNVIYHCLVIFAVWGLPKLQ